MSYNIIRDQKNQGKSLFIIFVVLLFFGSALFINLFKLTGLFIKTNRLLSQQELEKKKVEAENNKLRYLLKKQQTEKYFEEKARQLSLSKKDELILIPPAIKNTPTPKLSPTPKKSPYQQWMALFFLKF